ncbi:MAG: DUF116 domain-containing protein [Nitrospirae bacterium]|nr:DUF116 domain-containing protein [Nitrospirota bacterium]
MKSGWVRAITLKVLYPFFMLLGSFSAERKERLQGLIIGMNNSLLKLEKLRARRILLLLPHCLQINECDIRLTYNIHNCKKCGRCEIKELIRIADENSLDLFVATGGNLARKIVKDLRPEAIVAVACERDLSSGIADSFPLPVFGIPNERPFGPCFNTKVSLDKVREAIEFFCKE